MTVPVVDVVVAVHTAQRPVERAVASVLGTAVPVRVTLVCHHVPPADVEERLGDVRRALAATPHTLRLLPFADGVASPAGPFNRGLAEASAPYVALLGSDDVLEPGALDAWVALAQRDGADMVVPRLRHAAAPGGGAGAVVPTPPVRPWRTRGLDLVRDRLAYRSAPLGLLRRETVAALGLAMTPGLSVGEDVAFGLRLWSGAAVTYARRAPAYVIGADASDRVTSEAKPVAAELACVHDAITRPDLAGLDRAARRAVAVKLTRIHVFGAVHNRASAAHTWTDADLAGLRDAAHALARWAPGHERVLSCAERDLLDAVREPVGPEVSPADAAARGAVLVNLSARRRRHGTWPTLRTRDVRALLAREAPLRFMAASVLATR